MHFYLDYDIILVMNNMYEILSDNLTRLRKSRNLTQAEFADIIKYSDKSVSKWETGMSVPNLETLVEIADFYGMTLDDLVKKPVDSEKVLIVEKIQKTNKLTITLLSIAAVWLLATIIFVYSILSDKGTPWWQSFIWAIPASFILAIIFSAIWNRKFLFVSLSGFLWSIILGIFIQTLPLQNTYLFFIVGVPIQVIIILSRGMNKANQEEGIERISVNEKKRQERKRLKKQIRELNRAKSRAAKEREKSN